MKTALLYFLLALWLLQPLEPDPGTGAIHTAAGVTLLPDGGLQTEPSENRREGGLMEHPYIPPGSLPDPDALPEVDAEEQRLLEAEAAWQKRYSDYVNYLYEHLDESWYTFLSFGDSETSDLIIGCLDREAVTAFVDASHPGPIRVALVDGEGPSVAHKRALYETIVGCDLIRAHPERVHRVVARGYGIWIELIEPFDELRTYLAQIDLDPPVITVYEGDYKLPWGGTGGLDGYLQEETVFTERDVGAPYKTYPS